MKQPKNQSDMTTRCVFILAIILYIPLIGASQDPEGPERFEKSIREFEQLDKEMPFPDGAVLFVGSSSIKIWDSLDEDFPGVKAVNRGFGGSQFSDLLYFIDRVVTCYKPSKIFIYEGDNDIAAKEKVQDIVKEAKQVREIIARELPGVQVLFISAKPSVARWKLKKKYMQLNSELSLYAGRTPFTGFVNVWTPAIDASGEVIKDIFFGRQPSYECKRICYLEESY